MVGTDRRMSLFDAAARAKEMKKKGEITEDLDTKVVTDTPLTFPNGCHVAEVEVDPATGFSRLASYSAVDDSGNILDHTIVAGQVHGSVAMGVGQAMMEQTVYDEGGQLAQRVVHGLRHAARRGPADVQGRGRDRAGDHQSARAARAPAKPAPRRRSPRS